MSLLALQNLSVTIDGKPILRGIDLSVLGALRATQEFTPLLEAGGAGGSGTGERSGGSVVMMASAVIHHSRERYAGYKIAKTALVALGHSLATELGPRGIRVNTVAPGYTATERLQKLHADPAEADKLRSRIPARRFGEPGEVAAAIAFLATNEAGYINGQELLVDGGWSI